LKARKTAFPAAPETLARFLTERADNGYAVSTLRRYVSAIRTAHVADGFDDPTKAPLIAAVIDGIARERGTASEGKAALSLVELSRIIGALPETHLGVRDRAIILLGFAAALRRSELAALDIEDLRFTEDGVELLIRASKTDQRRAGQHVFVPLGDRLCPVVALRHWLEISEFATGPVFRRISRGDRVLDTRLSGQGIATAVKRAGGAVGLDPDTLGGHSLRAGFVTEAARRGETAYRIMATTRHRSTESLKAYIRPGLHGERGAIGLL
jgi:integrase